MSQRDLQRIKEEMDRRFKPYFNLVQAAANKQGAQFFMDSGEGRDIITEEFEGEDISGWLIPLEQAREFEKEWMQKQGKNIDGRWDRYYLFAIWSLVDGKVDIAFKRFDW